jgi:hypothetical protein
MFLSKQAIIKQLFYEFLHFKALALAPGRPVELSPGTLLGSSLKADLSLGIEFAEHQLRTYLNEEAGQNGEKEQFNQLLKELIAYKKASSISKNPFDEYAQADITTAHPCAWLVFAPLLIDPAGSSLSFETEQEFLNYLRKPKVGFHFDKNASLHKTGLYLAVQTQNHEMVDAFLCPEFYGYHLTRDDLKKLLALTPSTQTRLTLFRHSKQLINWIGTDQELQEHCVLSFEELSGLWSYLSEDQRQEFITHTNPQLWLTLLDTELGRQKIVKLLGPNFQQLNTKLMQDTSIKRPELVHKTLHYLAREQQLEYLLQRTDTNKLFPMPRGEHWYKLLASLGYKTHVDGTFTTTRYVLPDHVARIHNYLLSTLISLPIDAQIVLEAIAKIEAYINHPETEAEYKQFLNVIAKDVVRKEYEKGFFLVNWFNKLLRFLNFKSESPLHPYLDKLARTIKEEAVATIPGEIMDILPATQDYSIYKNALSAYFDGDIGGFWLNLSAADRSKILHTPIRFEALLRFLSNPVDYRQQFFSALDGDSLAYFNTPTGLRQLILDTPSLNAAKDLPLIIKAMERSQILFLEDAAALIEVLLDKSEELVRQVAPFAPFKANTLENLEMQEAVLNALPKPLQKEHLNRFLQAYCDGADHFSALLLRISNSNPLLAGQCWDLVSDAKWAQWYKGLEHAQPWAQAVKHLDLASRFAFFEKLASGGKLTAEEFCDFLLEKDEAVFITLWDKVPEQQWVTWLEDNELPSTTGTLLKTMAYPLRVQFFKAMLDMTEGELDSLCGSSDKTLEQFYPQDVANKISRASTVSDAKAKLAKLKETKGNEFDVGVRDLTAALLHLGTQFKALHEMDLKAHKGWGTYTASFFVTDPYYKLVTEITKGRVALAGLDKQILAHPLWALLKNQSSEIPALASLIKAVDILRSSLDSLHVLEQDMPGGLSKELQSIETLLKKIELIKQGSAAKKQEEAESNVKVSENGAPLVENRSAVVI